MVASTRLEDRYLVFKRKDLEVLDDNQRRILNNLRDKVNAGRQQRGRKPLDVIVVEHDWPEFAALENKILSRTTVLPAGSYRENEGIVKRAVPYVVGNTGGSSPSSSDGGIGVAGGLHLQFTDEVKYAVGGTGGPIDVQGKVGNSPLSNPEAQKNFIQRIRSIALKIYEGSKYSPGDRNK